MSNTLPLPSEPDFSPAPAGAENAVPVPVGRMVGEEGESRGPSFVRYLAALQRHRWIVLLATIGGVALGLGAMRFVKPKYEAQSTIWVEVSSRTDAGQGPIRTGELLESYAWIELLRSYSVLDQVVLNERLYVDPLSPPAAPALATFRLAERFRPGEYHLAVSEDGSRFTLSTPHGTTVEEGALGGPVGAKAGFEWVPPPGTLRPGEEISFVVRSPRDVARGLGEQLESQMFDNGRFVRLSLAGTDPERITLTLNAVADRYVAVAAQLKRAKLDELTGILEEQRRYAEGNLRGAEMALESFRVNTITLPSDNFAPVAAGLQLTRDPVFTRYFDTKVEREQLHRDRETIASVLATTGGAVPPLDELAAIPSVQSSLELQRVLAERIERRAELRALRVRYTGEHSAVQRLEEQIAAMESTVIPNAARTLSAQLATREAELDQRIDESSANLRQIPSRSIEEARLQRAVTIAENLYGTLRQRSEEARLAAVSSLPDLRVLDRAAVPSAPVEDRRPMLVLLSILGSMGLAVVGVLVADRVDRRIRYPEEVTGEMGLSILGAVPHIKRLNAAGKDDGTIQLAEAFRELRLSSLHAHGLAGPMLLTISSPASGDGKSFVASNLAAAFADQGHATLLVDGDIRRGTLHRAFERHRSPGLTDFLAGREALEAIIQPTEIPNLSLIGSGTRMQSGPELLGSAAMREMVHLLRSRYSVILLDSPPLGAGVDPFLLSTLSGNLLLVLRTGCTDRSLAAAKLDLLDRLPVRVLGAVLNAVPPSGIYGRYHYGYLPGYSAEEEAGSGIGAGTAGV